MIGSQDLAYLRQGSLRITLICALCGLYVWGGWLLVARGEFQPVWWSLAILAVAIGASYLLQERSLTLASVVVLAGMAAAILYHIHIAGVSIAPYFLAVVISLAGLLLSRRGVAFCALSFSAALWAIGVFDLGYPSLAGELWAPILILCLVGFVSTLATRNLYMALAWAWDRALAAQAHLEQLRDRQGELRRTLKSLDEAYSRLESLNYELAHARAVAEEARLLKQQFVTNVSHELRTPLNIIVAFSEMMYLSPASYGGVPLPPEYLGDVREIYRSSQHLLKLIDDVLDLSKIEAGRMRLSLEPTDLRAVVDAAFEIIRPLVRGKGLELRAELADDLPILLLDHARIRQVLLNLLNNARRFTDQGSITVRAVVEGQRVRVSVSDTGIGIPPSEHQKVFEDFRQLDGSTTRAHEGSGLGLAISKHFVEMHGGQIWVESEGVPGQGSTFHFTLPLASAATVEPSLLQRVPLAPLAPKRRRRALLLLDPDPAIVRLLEHGLSDYRIVPVADTAQALQIAAAERAEAAIVNLGAGAQAWQQVEQLRQHLGDSPLPIVLCPLAGEREVARALGVVDYLVKPVDRAAVHAVLERLGDEVKRILILDDDPRFARLLSRLVQSAPRPYEVVRSYSGADGLAKMRRHRPDLVLLDLVMPGMDGLAVLTHMQADATLRRTKVVVITAREATPEQVRKLGGGLLAVTSAAGFSNEEALRYLRGVLGANAAAPAPLANLTAGES